MVWHFFYQYLFLRYSFFDQTQNKKFTSTLKFSRPGYLKFTTVRADQANTSHFGWPNPNITLHPTVDGRSRGNHWESGPSTSEPMVCQMERAFQPRFCNQPPPNACCWPSRSTTRRLRFRCTGGRIVYHFFEWIHTCQCSSVACERALGNFTSEHKLN